MDSYHHLLGPLHLPFPSPPPSSAATPDGTQARGGWRHQTTRKRLSPPGGRPPAPSRARVKSPAQYIRYRVRLATRARYSSARRPGRRRRGDGVGGPRCTGAGPSASRTGALQASTSPLPPPSRRSSGAGYSGVDRRPPPSSCRPGGRVRKRPNPGCLDVEIPGSLEVVKDVSPGDERYDQLHVAALPQRRGGGSGGPRLPRSLRPC